ncbi:MAG: hypothetical protein QXQ66_09885 [Candidatus Hadarchaeum sp.]
MKNWSSTGWRRYKYSKCGKKFVDKLLGKFKARGEYPAPVWIKVLVLERADSTLFRVESRPARHQLGNRPGGGGKLG